MEASRRGKVVVVDVEEFPGSAGVDDDDEADDDDDDDNDDDSDVVAGRAGEVETTGSTSSTSSPSPKNFSSDEEAAFSAEDSFLSSTILDLAPVTSPSPI